MKKLKKSKKARRPAKAPKLLRKTPVSEITPEQQIVGGVFVGKVLDYLSKVQAITVILETPLAVGDSIWIKGHTTDLTQRVERLEIDHVSVASAVPGEEAAIAVADRVRRGDAVFKI